jgi:electron transport complex protein RnfB
VGSGVLAAIISMTSIGVVLGFGLGWAARRLPPDSSGLVERIDALLPQSQCAQCGFPGCRPYATAIAAGDAGINLCPPGGEVLIRDLGALLGQQVSGNEALQLDPSVGAPADDHVVRIDENECIGCALCLPACPVDAIVGAHGLMHTVLASECTGCDLCLPPCPVDCIHPAPRQPARRRSTRPSA